MSRKKYKTVVGFTKDLPKHTQQIFKKLWMTCKQATPKAEETISYNIPCLKLNKSYIVYAAGYEKHVSIYPLPRTAGQLKTQIEKYKAGKGTLKFPIDKPLPLPLIKKVVKQLITDNEKRALR